MDVLRTQPRCRDLSLSLFCCSGLQQKQEKQKTPRWWCGGGRFRRLRGERRWIEKERSTRKETRGASWLNRKGEKAGWCGSGLIGFWVIVCLLNILIQDVIIWLHQWNVIRLQVVTTQWQIKLEWTWLSVWISFYEGRSEGNREERRRQWMLLFACRLCKFMPHAFAFIQSPALTALLFPWSQAVYNLCSTRFIFYLNEIILNTLLN